MEFNKDCRSIYWDNDICFPYNCNLEEGHDGPHVNDIDGPGMRWVA